MGEPIDSFEHDALLESVCLKILKLAEANDGALGVEHGDQVKKWLRQVQDTRSYKNPTARVQSVYRFSATAWEALCVDFYQKPNDAFRGAPLLCLSARIVAGALNQPERITPMMNLAKSKAGKARDLFDQEAGRTGGIMDALTSITRETEGSIS